jgi:lipid-A-disaccharide synthase
MVAHRDPQREAQIRAILRREGADFVEFGLGQVAEKLAAARVVLAKSGTGSLEAALAGAPTVVVYRVANAFMSFAYRNYLSVPWFAAANLVAARSVLPERCFHTDEAWGWVAGQVEELWPYDAPRLRCLDQLADVQHRLGEPGASARAAQWVLAALGFPLQAAAPAAGMDSGPRYDSDVIAPSRRGGLLPGGRERS